MQQKKYLEFNVLVDGGKIIEKMPTARKSVMVWEHEVERMNSVSMQTRLYYELAEEKVVEKEPVKEIKDEFVMVAKIDLPQPFDAESFVKTAKIEDFVSLNENEVNSALALMSKRTIVNMFSIEIDEKKFGLTSHKVLEEKAIDAINKLK